MKKAGTILLISAFLVYLYCANIKDMTKLTDLTGKTFGQTKVLKFHSRVPSGKQTAAIWLCECLGCGKHLTRTTQSVKKHLGGCITCSNTARATHGMTKSPEYKSWQGMNQRCSNPNDDHYEDYGLRGISVSERWINSFENFLSDMGLKPSKRHTIDRKDVNGNYTPENCKWSTPMEQGNNRRNNRNLTLNGETLTLSQWSRKLNKKESTITSRLDRTGMSVEDALTLPLLRKYKNKA